MPRPKLKLRRLLFPPPRAWPRLLVIALCGSMIVGCPNNSRRVQTNGKPALELRKAVSFALAAPDLPATPDALQTAIVDGLRDHHVKLPDNRQTVLADGDAYPALRRLTVDLTDAAIDTGNKPPKLNPREIAAPGVHAQQFQFRADPLQIDGGQVHLDVSARDVNFGVIHDRAGRPVLSLDDARDGQVTCQTTTRDLGAIFRASANQRGKSFGLTVQKAKLRLSSKTQHDLSADLRLVSHLLLVPIQLHFTARVVVDNAGNARLTDLWCDGDDAAGWLITQFIRPALDQYNNITMPLVGFPSPKVRLHDVSVRIEGENVRLDAAFGS